MPDCLFSIWAAEWADEIEQIQLFTKSDLPATAGIQKDLNRTTRDYPRIGELLADVERFVITYRATETLLMAKAKDGLTAPERKVIVESRIADILRVRDVLKTTEAALRQRSFALLNQRKYAEAELRMLKGSEG